MNGNTSAKKESTPSSNLGLPKTSSEPHKGEAMRSNTLPPPPVSAIRETLGLQDIEVAWLAGDGSDRCYYRIFAGDKTFVLMQLSGDDAIQLQNNGYEWVKIGRLLHDHGIYAPQTVRTMPDFAALIIEDYGDLMMETKALAFLEKGQRGEALELYRQSFSILSRFLEIKERGQSKWSDRSFDSQRLDWELHFFKEQFLKNVLGWTLSPSEEKAFQADALKIAESLASQSKYFVHRDFHSRNVMVTGDKLAVIDFQDARLGPPTYDLVSICFDSYIPLKPTERTMLVAEGIDYMVDRDKTLDKTRLKEEWGPMLLQRQLKALGSFGYLTTQKNRGNYLKYVPAALETLAPQNVGHAAWSFLSTDLIQGIHARWKNP